MNAPHRDNVRKRLLDLIRRNGPVARIDLAEASGVSRATVTTITADLIAEGMVEEVSSDQPSEERMRRGRPRVDLVIRNRAHLVAGMKIASRSISVALVDFNGQLFAEAEAGLPAPVLEADALAEVLRSALLAALSPHGLSLKDVSAVGIGIAGIVDAMRGFVYWSPSLKERNLALQDIIAARLGLPICLDNDANLVAMAEKSFGYGKDASDFLVVTVESGVGMGVVLNGEIYRGTRGCGAEFGHTKVHLDGALCRCGQRGCLEAYVADYSLLREQASIAPETLDLPPEQRIEMLLDAARQGDDVASSIVARAGRMFALGLANLVNIFDPQLIILAGERMQFDHLYAEEVMAAMRASIVQIDKAPPEVKIHKWGDLMWARGAAAFALEWVTEKAAQDATVSAG
ncbi:MAG: ROK family protein [Pseudomonadota bacterium]